MIKIALGLFVCCLLAACSSPSGEYTGVVDNKLVRDDAGKYERLPVVSVDGSTYILDFAGAAKTVTGMRMSSDNRFRNGWARGEETVFLSLQDTYLVIGNVDGEDRGYPVLKVKSMQLIQTAAAGE
jgi:hypothetical protein